MFSTVGGFLLFWCEDFTSLRGSLVKERDFRNCRREVVDLRLELLNRKKMRMTSMNVCQKTGRGAVFEKIYAKTQNGYENSLKGP